MTPEHNGVHGEGSLPDSYVDIADQEPGLMDAIRFLYRRRVKLTFHFLSIFGLGTLVFIYLHFISPKTIEGIIGLGFPEVKSETYPSGRQFSLEDFRSPGVLTQAMADAQVSSQRISLRDLAAHVDVTPVIPAEVQNRWKKQEQSGAKKEAYVPSDFKISIAVSQLTDPERMRLFDGLVKRYQETVKYDQKSALLFMSSSNFSYDQLVRYDSWDVPELFEITFRTLKQNLSALVKESAQYQDASYTLSFLDVAKDLDAWELTRLQPVEALTYEGKLVKNPELIAQRIRFRLQELQIAVQQKSLEAIEAGRLLEIISRRKTLVAGQLNSRESLPVIDASVLDKLIRTDYVGPVVQRISMLQEDLQGLETERGRLERQLVLLPKSTDGKSVALPPEYQGLVTSLSEDLHRIIQKYNRLLDEYLTATVTSLVVVKQAPLVSRAGYPPTLVMPGIALLSLFLAIVLLGLERMFERVRAEEAHDTAS